MGVKNIRKPIRLSKTLLRSTATILNKAFINPRPVDNKARGSMAMGNSNAASGNLIPKNKITPMLIASRIMKFIECTMIFPRTRASVGRDTMIISLPLFWMTRLTALNIPMKKVQSEVERRT